MIIKLNLYAEDNCYTFWLDSDFDTIFAVLDFVTSWNNDNVYEMISEIETEFTDDMVPEGTPDYEIDVKLTPAIDDSNAGFEIGQVKKYDNGRIDIIDYRRVFLVCTEGGGVIDVVSSKKSFNEVYRETIGSNYGEILVALTDETIDHIVKASQWRLR